MAMDLNHHLEPWCVLIDLKLMFALVDDGLHYVIDSNWNLEQDCSLAKTGLDDCDDGGDDDDGDDYETLAELRLAVVVAAAVDQRRCSMVRFRTNPVEHRRPPKMAVNEKNRSNEV